ncbi:MAG: hypothetical protein COV37_06995 [Bdellovibrio sp. CG11_big_fil_rev_8_21_14_0_20_39_38]|nr:MAG: hypothetical protein COW78_11055 [Bdellovibrio sp. CG22_combo_CG10-13_8_21_14_all_39_27]PIR35743.1 MAG: hypothetical protein COV37_06995 [Bdellovibrio sp. CG11_big_fil_rev_8_21_14_0_20_39_38]PJB52690.1 MAG: hypothetical protein CO099_11270 [Bdellovibrio sp. CG_4_9_14_3_um_filter_39_7]
MKIICLILILLTSAQAETIIVSAERFDRPLIESTGSVQYIGREEIERSGSTNLGDLLKAKAGITTVNNGSFGKSGSLFIRGTDSRHALIIIDGVVLNDPTSIAGEPRFEYIALSDIESVEVLKGSQSALYGQQAIGGVIKIRTVKSTQPRSQLHLSGGNFGQKVVGFNTTGAKDHFQYSLSGEHQEASGISAAASSAAIQEKDPYSLQTIGVALQYQTKNFGDLKASTRQIKGSSDFDNQPSDDAQYSHYTQSIWSLGYVKEWSELKWNTQYQFTDVVRDSTGNYHYQAEQKKIESNLDYKIVGLGAAYQKDKANVLDSILTSQKLLETKSLFARVAPHWEIIGFDLAARYENYNLFEDEWSYRAGLNLQLISNLHLKSSYSTGTKSPGLYQLFGQYGNLQLKPEHSHSKDVGLVWDYSTQWLELNYFEVDYQNYINFGTSRYENVSGAEIKGVEFIAKKSWSQFDGQFSFTQLSTRDHSTNRQLIRRPKQQAQLMGTFYLNDQLDLNSEVTYLGRRDDVGGNSPSYLIASLGSKFQFETDKYVGVNIKNLLDHDYQEIKGYQSVGRNFTLNFGMKW